VLEPFFGFGSLGVKNGFTSFAGDALNWEPQPTNMREVKKHEHFKI
jgi:hypothetical protein